MPCRSTAFLLMPLTAARASVSHTYCHRPVSVLRHPSSTSAAEEISSNLESTAQWLKRFEAESSTVQPPLFKHFRCAEARALSCARQHSCSFKRNSSLLLPARSTFSRGHLPQENAQRQEALQLSDHFTPDRHFQRTAAGHELVTAVTPVPDQGSQKACPCLRHAEA